MIKRKKWPLAKAMSRLRTQNLKSKQEYRVWIKSLPKGFPIPYNPERYYGKEFPGWLKYLSIEYVTQSELKSIVDANKISTVEEYRDFAREYKSELCIPVYPEKVYASLGQQFIGFRRLLFSKKKCLSCASKWAEQSGIQSYAEWKSAGRKRIPKEVYFYYRHSKEIDFKKFLRGGYYESDSCTCGK